MGTRSQCHRKLKSIHRPTYSLLICKREKATSEPFSSTQRPTSTLANARVEGSVYIPTGYPLIKKVKVLPVASTLRVLLCPIVVLSADTESSGSGLHCLAQR